MARRSRLRRWCWRRFGPANGMGRSAAAGVVGSIGVWLTALAAKVCERINDVVATPTIIAARIPGCRAGSLGPCDSSQAAFSQPRAVRTQRVGSVGCSAVASGHWAASRPAPAITASSPKSVSREEAEFICAVHVCFAAPGLRAWPGKTACSQEGEHIVGPAPQRPAEIPRKFNGCWCLLRTSGPSQGGR